MSVRADGSVPDPDKAAAADPAVNLPVFTDTSGVRWIKVGRDAYVEITSQLITAIVVKWPLCTRVQAEAGAGPLHPLGLV